VEGRARESVRVRERESQREKVSALLAEKNELSKSLKRKIIQPKQNFDQK
jgi:hypothetical protein